MAELIKRSELVEKIWERHDYISKHPEDYDNTDEVQDELCGIVAVADELPPQPKQRFAIRLLRNLRRRRFTLYMNQTIGKEIHSQEIWLQIFITDC